jgi:hypothetical protein
MSCTSREVLRLGERRMEALDVAADRHGLVAGVDPIGHGGRHTVRHGDRAEPQLVELDHGGDG